MSMLILVHKIMEINVKELKTKFMIFSEVMSKIDERVSKIIIDKMEDNFYIFVMQLICIYRKDYDYLALCSIYNLYFSIILFYNLLKLLKYLYYNSKIYTL